MDAWRFAIVSDIHIGTQRSFRFQAAWNANWQTVRQQIIDQQPEFLLVCGDMTRDGLYHRFELEQSKADLDALPFPYYAVPGNHDAGNKFSDADSSISAETVALYQSVFGTSNYSICHKNIRISVFNSLLAGSGLAEEGAMWSWLDSQVPDLESDHHLWMTHAPIYLDYFSEANKA